jgi:hypothetical protein
VAWAGRNCRQAGSVRQGAGSMPAARRISHTVDGATARPGFVSSPRIRRCPVGHLAHAAQVLPLDARGAGALLDLASFIERAGRQPALPAGLEGCLIQPGHGEPAHHLCVPKTSSTSGDQAVLVDLAASASLFSDAVVVEVDWFG